MAQWPGWRGCSPITESVSTPKGPMETDNRMGEYSRASCEKESRKEAPGAHPPPFCHPSFLQKTKGTCQPLAPQNISFQSRGGHGRGAASFINAALFWGAAGVNACAGMAGSAQCQGWPAIPRSRVPQPISYGNGRRRMQSIALQLTLAHSRRERTYWYAKAAWRWPRVERRQT